MFAVLLYVSLVTTAFADSPAPVVAAPVAAPVVAAPVAPAAPVVVAPAAPTAPDASAPAVPPAAPVAAPAVPTTTPPPVVVPTTDAQAAAQGMQALNAVQIGEWSTAGVLLIGLLVFAYNRFIAKKAS